MHEMQELCRQTVRRWRNPAFYATMLDFGRNEEGNVVLWAGLCKIPRPGGALGRHAGTVPTAPSEQSPPPRSNGPHGPRKVLNARSNGPHSPAAQPPRRNGPHGPRKVLNARSNGLHGSQATHLPAQAVEVFLLCRPGGACSSRRYPLTRVSPFFRSVS